MREELLNIIYRYVNDEIQARFLSDDVKDLIEKSNSLTLLDKFAIEAMKSEIITWNSEMSKEHRIAILEDMNQRYGDNTSVNDCIAKMSYDMAESMIKVKKEKNNNEKIILFVNFCYI